MLLVPTHTRGVDPIVGRFVDRQLAVTAEASGDAVVRGGETAQAELGALSMDELWRLMHMASARRAVSAVVWAKGGRYRVRLHLASADGLGPFVAEGSADAPGLEPRVDALLRQLLAELSSAASEHGAAGTPVGASARPVAAPEAAGPRVVTLKRDPFGARADPPPPDPDAWRFGGANAELRLLRLGVRSDAAFGVGDHRFFNMLLGVRALYRVDTDTALGGYLGYVNVKTRGGRGAASLTGLALEHRIPVDRSEVSVPLRMLVGYLAANGSVLRLSAGLGYMLDEHTSLSVDLLSPTFWVTPDRTLLSLDVGAELSADF
jgi:hypothetical protein